MIKTIQWLVILFIAALVFHIRIININLNPYDESVILVGAERILNGEIPYRDFFSQYTPGQFYALAAVFKIFGISVISGRIYDIIIKAFLSLIVFLIIRLLTSNKYAVTGWAASLIWGGYINFPLYPVYPSLLFIYMSVYLMLLYFKQERLYYASLSAVSIVISILFRHDLGGLAAIMIIFVLVLKGIVKIRSLWRSLISFIGSGIAVGFPIIVYFYIYSDMGSIISNLITFPLSEFQEFQSLPYPRYLSAFTLPFFVFPGILLAGLIITPFFIKCKLDNTLTYGILLISLIGTVFLIQAGARSDIVHLLPLGLTSVLLAPILLYALLRGFSFSTGQQWLTAIIFITVLGLTLYKPITMRISAFPEKYTIKALNPDIPRAKYIRLRDTDIKKVITFVRENTSKNEYIYSGLKNHDKLVFNDASIYFLAERKCATKYHELNPGFTTLPEVQKEMVKELKDRDVRLVVLIPGLWNGPDLSSYDQKTDVLDNYISGNFELRASFGSYEIWMRRS